MFKLLIEIGKLFGELHNSWLMTRNEIRIMTIARQRQNAQSKIRRW